MVVVGEHGEDGDAIFGAGVNEGFAGVVLAHRIDEAAEPSRQSAFWLSSAAFVKDLFDEVGNLGVFGAAGVAVFRDDRL